MRSGGGDGESGTTFQLPTGRMDIMTGKLRHGTACRHEFWADALGTDADDTFAVPAVQVVQVREMAIATKARHK